MKRNPSSTMKRSTLFDTGCNSVNSFRHDSSHTALGRSSLPNAQHRKHQSLLKSTMDTVLLLKHAATLVPSAFQDTSKIF